MMETIAAIGGLMALCIVWGLLSAADGTGETSRGCGGCAGGACGDKCETKDGPHLA